MYSTKPQLYVSSVGAYEMKWLAMLEHDCLVPSPDGSQHVQIMNVACVGLARARSGCKLKLALLLRLSG